MLFRFFNGHLAKSLCVTNIDEVKLQVEIKVGMISTWFLFTMEDFTGWLLPPGDHCWEALRDAFLVPALFPSGEDTSVSLSIDCLLLVKMISTS